MLSSVWNNPAGGIRYHTRALFHAHAWQPFRDGLSAWLSAWRPGRKTLALVGPSAGYCLPVDALAQFERLVVFELDPVARYLLKRRLLRAAPTRPIEWIEDDRWIAPVLHGGEPPSALLGPDCAVLFTNIIGQMPYLLEPADYPAFRTRWCEKLFPWLAETPWASFHDRVSGDVAPFEALPTHAHQLSDAEVSALYEADPAHHMIELNDHRSQDLLPSGYRYRYLHWPLTRSMHHLIECVLGGPSDVSP